MLRWFMRIDSMNVHFDRCTSVNHCMIRLFFQPLRMHQMVRPFTYYKDKDGSR